MGVDRILALWPFSLPTDIVIMLGFVVALPKYMGCYYLLCCKGTWWLCCAGQLLGGDTAHVFLLLCKTQSPLAQGSTPAVICGKTG